MTPRKDDAYLIRFPDGMRKALKEEATDEGRTLAAHIVYLLSTHPSRPKAKRPKK